LVPAQQSRELYEALKAANVESTLKTIPGAGPGGPAFNSPENLKMIADFFDQHLLRSSAAARLFSTS
jgi:dipeptidyl aminopeptidase/acylaminoacyl peptidase